MSYSQPSGEHLSMMQNYIFAQIARMLYFLKNFVLSENNHTPSILAEKS